MERPPCVSIIIPAFNCAAFIGHTLESALKQEYRDWECIVADDGSADNTAEVVTSYADRDKRIIYVYQKNGGPSEARNKGLSLARGKYIQFLDADDLLESRKLQCHAQYLENNSDVDIVYGGARYFRAEHPNERRYSFLAMSNDGHSMADDDKTWMPEVSGSGKVIQEALVKTNIMVVSAPLLRRRIVDQVGPFDSGLPSLEDWDYWLRCAVAGGRFQYLDEVGTLSLIRLRSNSLSQNRLKTLTQARRIRRKWNKILQDKSLIEYNIMALAACDGHIGVKLIEEGRLPGGIQLLLKSAYRSQKWKESLKWMYSAMVAPFAPRNDFQKIAYSPIKESLKLLLKIGG
jgi:glycosyltransferase involved in cell wall biosynthesis